MSRQVGPTSSMLRKGIFSPYTVYECSRSDEHKVLGSSEEPVPEHVAHLKNCKRVDANKASLDWGGCPWPCCIYKLPAAFQQFCLGWIFDSFVFLEDPDRLIYDLPTRRQCVSSFISYFLTWALSSSPLNCPGFIPESGPPQIYRSEIQ